MTSQIANTKANTKAITWDELAEWYDKNHVGKARTLPRDTVFHTARISGDFTLNTDGTLSLIGDEK